MPKLDARLRVAADWVAPCEICADIGCDHGRFGAALLREGRCRLLLAADVSAPSLSKAETRLTRLGFADRVVFTVADGLEALSAIPGGRADTICILGMGGETVAGILRRGAGRLQGATLIVGAQTELPLTRQALQQSGYRLADERIAIADGRLYLLMRALPDAKEDPPYTERQLLLGPCLLRDQPANWKPWLIRKQRLLEAAVAAMRKADRADDAARLLDAETELRYTKEALCALNARHGTLEPEKEERA